MREIFMSWIFMNFILAFHGRQQRDARYGDFLPLMSPIKPGIQQKLAVMVHHGKSVRGQGPAWSMHLPSFRSGNRIWSVDISDLHCPMCFFAHLFLIFFFLNDGLFIFKNQEMSHKSIWRFQRGSSISAWPQSELNNSPATLDPASALLWPSSHLSSLT